MFSESGSYYFRASYRYFNS